MRTRFQVGALAFLVVSSLWGMSPAAAKEHEPLVVTIDQPAATTLTASPVTVAGTVKAPLDLIDIDWVTITLVPENEGGGPALGPFDACRPCTRPEPGKPLTFSKSISVSANGRYRAEVSAGKGLLLTDLKGTAIRSFGLAAPPRPPQDVKAEVSPEGAVTVSWARNVEPDILSYSVSRKDPGIEAYLPVGPPVEQPTSPRVSFSDPAPARVGGDFTYRVIAFRQGATPGSKVPSEPATADKVTVAAPPGGPAAPGAPGTGAGAGGFLTGGFPAGQPNSTAGGPRSMEIPDTGFSDVLPFGPRPPGEEMPEEPAEPRSLDVGTTTRTEFVSRGRPLVPIAGGAVLLLLAVHLRLMNKRMAAASPAVVAGRAENDLRTADLPYGRYGGVSRLAPAVVEVEPPPYEEPAPVRPQFYDWAQLPDDDLVDAVDDEWAGRNWDDYSDQDEDEVMEAMASSAR